VGCQHSIRARSNNLERTGDEIERQLGAYLRMEPMAGAIEAVRSLKKIDGLLVQPKHGGPIFNEFANSLLVECRLQRAQYPPDRARYAGNAADFDTRGFQDLEPWRRPRECKCRGQGSGSSSRPRRW
jgi:hypothetical protein